MLAQYSADRMVETPGALESDEQVFEPVAADLVLDRLDQVLEVGSRVIELLWLHEHRPAEVAQEDLEASLGTIDRKNPEVLRSNLLDPWLQ